MYRLDTSGRYHAICGTACQVAAADTRARQGETGQDEGAGHGQARRRARARGPRDPAREPHARLRAAQAVQRRAGLVPGVLLRLALPLPEGAAERRLDRRGHRRRGARRGREAVPDRLPAHRRGQGALPGAGRRERPVGLGGRRLRRALRVLRPHRRRDPATHPRGSPLAPRGADGRRARRAGAHPGAGRQLHPRAAASRARVRRARGPLAHRAHRDRARRHHQHREQHRGTTADCTTPDSTTPDSTTPVTAKGASPMGSVRVAIVGVGNCAASLVQGVEYYKDADPAGRVPGLMHVQFGDYHVRDVEFVAAFDVDAKKVGTDLADAIGASENNTIKIADVPPTGVTVQRGHTLDGLGKYYRETITESDSEPVDVVQALKDARVDVLVCYLPVGSEDAAKFYAQCAIDAKVGFVNALPVFIAGTPAWAKKFEDAGVPIVGDDIKSQVGATITHRVLAKLFEDRGVILDRTYQLNVGGNMDFKNMLERDRLESKKISKTQAVTSNMENKLSARNVHIGPSDYVQWLDDRKWAYVRLEGRNFGDVPLNLEYKLEVWDSPNSAGVIIDAIRCAKIAMDRGIGGPILSASSYFMKSPPVQHDDDMARDLVEQFIAGTIER